MDEMIMKVLDNYYLTENDLTAIKTFIQNCSLSQFEKLKEMDWDLSQE